jgi:hypothetical protein
MKCARHRVSQIPGNPDELSRGARSCALNKPLIKIVLWAYSVRPYNPISVQETTPGVWEAPLSPPIPKTRLENNRYTALYPYCSSKL